MVSVVPPSSKEADTVVGRVVARGAARVVAREVARVVAREEARVVARVVVRVVARVVVRVVSALPESGDSRKEIGGLVTAFHALSRRSAQQASVAKW